MTECSNSLENFDFHKIFENWDDGVLITDSQGFVLMHNQAYLRLTFLPFDSLVGMNMRELIRKKYATNVASLRVLEDRQPVSMTHSNENGTIVVSSNPVFDTHGSIAVVVTFVRELTEIVRLREELMQAKEIEEMYFKYNQKEYSTTHNVPIAVSKMMNHTLVLAANIAQVAANVLLTGESGVGKDVIANYIHEQSSRKEAPFIAVNCAALPENLLESELFGYDSGAFTGAARAGKPGLFEAAQGGTLFLDEIGDTSQSFQATLLRVLETKEIKRIGAVKPIKIDVQIIAATNRDLEDMIKAGEFRSDLFYRLNIFRIKIPTLRDRREDIIPLSMYFMNLFNNQYHRQKRLSHEVLRQLTKYDWPGNIRELRNVIERMVVMSNGDYLSVSELPESLRNDFEMHPSVIVTGIMPINYAIEETEKQILTNALRTYVSTRKIGHILGIDHSTVVRKLKKYRLK
ncbi:PAS domain S-box-containing protein/TyrR family helix-turn-helix domain-containing protein [Desulfosporosinus lacus DSM 15449]|uniref:HTH-type transcriptional regulatory protein TyrR n=2 Tax=Desulfosporosinus TaxID=79206 RepID=A0A1M5ZR83_9FIRM|nr:PAS domain S-box-containing protein/TyrR family helix-turn-helix domain-containing protein [Desulfosporosinus lacus DSM 15449]